MPADKRFALLHKVGSECLLPGCAVFLHAPWRTTSAHPAVRVPCALGRCSPWHADGQECIHTGRPTLPLFLTPHLFSAPIRCPHRFAGQSYLCSMHSICSLLQSAPLVQIRVARAFGGDGEARQALLRTRLLSFYVAFQSNPSPTGG